MKDGHDMTRDTGTYQELVVEALRLLHITLHSTAQFIISKLQNSADEKPTDNTWPGLVMCTWH